MKDLIIAANTGKYFIPQVQFIAQTGQCEIVGESYMEDVFEFYEKLGDWVKEYFTEGKDHLVLSIRISYFNTSSARAVLDFFKLLRDYQAAGKDIKAIWYYPEDDEDLFSEIEDLKIGSRLQIELKSVE